MGKIAVNGDNHVVAGRGYLRKALAACRGIATWAVASNEMHFGVYCAVLANSSAGAIRAVVVNNKHVSRRNCSKYSLEKIVDIVTFVVRR
jgi:hypothetical protein